MKDYNKLVMDYIDNKITNEYELSLLYNNMNFMKRLIIKTNNSDYYNLCSNRIKTNINFVLFLINYFDDDLNFLFKVIDNYNYSSNPSTFEPKYIKLLIKIDQFIKNREKEIDYTVIIKYTPKIINLFDCYQSYINNRLQYLSKEELKNNRLGFYVIKHNFPKDTEIQSFFANRFLNKLFYEYDFEDYIHKNYESKELLLKCDKLDILLNYVRSYDVQLYLFAKKNNNLIKDKEIRLNQMIDNYDDYILDNINEKIRKFNDSLSNYIEEIKPKFSLDLIKIEEISRLGLSKEFYGQDVVIDNLVEDSSFVDFEREKARLFIRTELQSIFKNKTRKLNLKVKNDQN